jgi:hypothetical protein
LRNGFAVWIIFFTFVSLLFVFLTDLSDYWVQFTRLLFEDEVAKEIIGCLSDVLSNLDEFLYSYVFATHETKTCLDRVRKGDIIEAVEHASRCILFILLDCIWRLLQAKILVPSREKFWKYSAEEEVFRAVLMRRSIGEDIRLRWMSMKIKKHFHLSWVFSSDSFQNSK